MDVQAFRFQIRKFFWSSWKGKNISNWWQGFWIEEHLRVQFGDNLWQQQRLWHPRGGSNHWWGQKSGQNQGSISGDPPTCIHSGWHSVTKAELYNVLRHMYSTSVTAMVASGFHGVRWTLLFIICLTQLMTQSRVWPRVGTVTLALWLTSTIIAAATLLQLAHWLTSRAQRGSCPQIILCSPLFGFFWRVCDYAKIDPETSQNEILPSFRYAISWCGTNVRKTLSFNLQMRFWRKQSIANLPFSALAGSELPELVKTKVPISRDLCNRPPERQ